jgi:hypothetical protein
MENFECKKVSGHHKIKFTFSEYESEVSERLYSSIVGEGYAVAG